MNAVSRNQASQVQPIFFGICVLLLGAIISCNFFTNILEVPPTLSPARNDFYNAWLEDTSCPMPCWHGVQFGQTTITQTVVILNQLPEIVPVEIYSIMSMQGNKKFSYIGWTGNLGEIGSSGEISFSSEGIASEMRYDPIGSLTVQDIVDKMGEPSHIVAQLRPCHNAPCQTYLIELFYKTKGFLLSFGGVLQANEQVEFSSLATDFLIFFYDPKTYQYSEDLQEWHGFIGFDSYCLDNICKKPR